VASSGRSTVCSVPRHCRVTDIDGTFGRTPLATKSRLKLFFDGKQWCYPDSITSLLINGSESRFWHRFGSQTFHRKVVNAYDRLFLLKFQVRKTEISSRGTNRIRVSVTKQTELVFCSTKRSEISHITWITSGNLGCNIGLTISINPPTIMIRLRNAA
jgi:hypothetical protein